MKKTKNKRQKRVCTNIASTNGITLIALIITIIVLIILAGIAISLTLGENGIFTKAKEAAIKQDIEETRELIKLELMGSISEETSDYTNKDVIDAIKKVTGKEVTENEKTVLTKKENEADISDFWRKNKIVINFAVNGKNFSYVRDINENIYVEDFFGGWLLISGAIPEIKAEYQGMGISFFKWNESYVYIKDDYGVYHELTHENGDEFMKLNDGENYYLYYKENDEFKLIPLAD